jgi:ribosomal protein L14
MIQKRSVISIIDNSGILKIRIIKVIKHSYKYTGGLGDILVGSVQKGSIKKGNRDQKIYYTLLINIRC